MASPFDVDDELALTQAESLVREVMDKHVTQLRETIVQRMNNATQPMEEIGNEYS